MNVAKATTELHQSNRKSRHFDFNDPKTTALADILCEISGGVPARILVVGCGHGIEAAVLATHLGSEVVGIDLHANFDRSAANFADLRQGDATRMEFADESFDFVYSYHVLEHIPRYRDALSEIHRVLKPGCGYLIGTPNRQRLLGYLGSKGTPLIRKLHWNLVDWKARLRGKFRNELGAHAGYALEELQGELANVFSHVESITPKYYSRIYASKQSLLTRLCSTGLWRWVFPAIYFYGVR